MVTKFHVALILVFLVMPLILYQFKNELLHAGFDTLVKKLEGFKNVMYDINKKHPHLTFWCGTAMMTAYAWLVCVNHTYERMLLWFVGFAKRMGLDKVMTRRVLMSVTALTTLVVIEVQSFTALTFLSSMFVSLVSLVVVTYDNDTSGFTEGVCICFFASGVVYAWQNVLYHALACFCVSGIAYAAKLTGG